MSKRILNISDVELKPRPAAFSPTGAAAERYTPRVLMVRHRASASLGAKTLA